MALANTAVAESDQASRSINAKVAELADALDLGSSAFGRGGSNPPFRTMIGNTLQPCQYCFKGSNPYLDQGDIITLNVGAGMKRKLLEQPFQGGLFDRR